MTFIEYIEYILRALAFVIILAAIGIFIGAFLHGIDGGGRR